MIKTATGKELGCDFAVESQNPDRLYIHLTELNFMETAGIFVHPEELPFDGWEQYTVIESIYSAPSGTNLMLRKA